MIAQETKKELINVGHGKFEKVFPKHVEAIFSGKFDSAYVHGRLGEGSVNKIWTLYQKVKSHPSEKEKCREGLMHLCKIKVFNMLEMEELMDGVINLFTMSPFWVRDIKTFDRPSRNAYKQLSGLIKHLFAKYPVPEFLEAAWYGKSKDSKHMSWYIHLGEGKSVREIKNMPIPMTKKMAHIFFNTPAYYGISEGIRRAQIIANGGDERLAHAILGTRLGRFHNISREEFWETFIDFIVKAPMFDYTHLGPMTDYIEHEKYEAQRVPLENGTFVVKTMQPGFSMKGRQLDLLIRDSEVWHKKISKLSSGDRRNEFWEPSGIKEFELAEGDPTSKNAKLFMITELLTSKELMDEGRVMGHCVYSYTHSCVKKVSSIWSLREKYIGERLATIEVNLSSKMVIQVRAKKNAQASSKAQTLINRWASNSGLDISRSAFGGW